MARSTPRQPVTFSTRFSPSSLSVSTLPVTALVACCPISLATRVTRAIGERERPEEDLRAPGRLALVFAALFAGRFLIAGRLAEVLVLVDAVAPRFAGRLPDFAARDWEPVRLPADFPRDFARDFLARAAMTDLLESAIELCGENSMN